MGLKKINRDKEAIEIFVKNFPNSFVADLLLYFDKEVVLKFIELYSGRRVGIPTIKNIWVNYRNNRIKEALDNDCTKKNREILAESFGLSIGHISVIYSGMSKRHIPRIKHRTILNLVDTVFRKNLRSFYKGMQELSGMKGKTGLLHNEMQNPEFLFFMNENKQEFIEKCINDIENHLVFSDRDNHKEKAISLLLEKMENEL